MSITFMPGIENHKPNSRTVQCCKEHDCYLCNGDGLYCTMDIPELNLSNVNAQAMMQLIGIPFVYAGSISCNKLFELRRNIIKLKNSPSLLVQAIRKDFISDNVYSMGIDMNYIFDRLKAFDEIFAYCQKHNESFFWS